MKKLMLLIGLLFLTTCCYSQISNHYVSFDNRGSDIKGYSVTIIGRSTKISTVYKSAPTQRTKIGNLRKNRMRRKLQRLEK